MAKFYITTTAPYVNADPHIGFALEIVQADILARYHTQLGDQVFFNTGTDEHGLKIYRKALETEMDPQTYCDVYADKFKRLETALDLFPDLKFVRTTNPNHIESAQEFWKRCQKNGDIYKRSYTAKYCVGCELKKTLSELVEGCCPIHPNLKIETIEEENYFFKFKKYEKNLLKLYENNPDFVVPSHRLQEIKNFVASGLEDFSISRLKSKMPWGVPVPNDPEHVMYVWFDALTYYISALDWPKDEKKFEKFWGTANYPNAIQIAGKDNLRQQSAMWQAMLLSAGLPPTRQILIHGFITSNGQKMSKSLGNVINPFNLANKYSTDAVRYFLLAKIDPFEDSDFTIEKFEEVYQSNLANGLGNLVQRVAKMCEGLDMAKIDLTPNNDLQNIVNNFLNKYQWNLALETIWQHISALDVWINRDRPWEKDVNQRTQILGKIVKASAATSSILDITEVLAPFLPQTAEKIKNIFSAEKITAPKTPLFPRL